MMADDHTDDIDKMLEDHPSLSASLEDFEERSRPSPLFGLPSQHSGFRSGISDETNPDPDMDSSCGESWSPPGFQRKYVLHQHLTPTPGSGWYRHQPYLRDTPDLRPTANSSPSRSREVSPQYEDAVESPVGTDDPSDLTVPANVPLPSEAVSPVKDRSTSPDPSLKSEVKVEEDGANDGSNNTFSENASGILTNCNPCLSAFFPS